jgi:hypothetical protein
MLPAKINFATPCLGYSISTADSVVGGLPHSAAFSADVALIFAKILQLVATNGLLRHYGIYRAYAQHSYDSSYGYGGNYFGTGCSSPRLLVARVRALPVTESYYHFVRGGAETANFSLRLGAHPVINVLLSYVIHARFA